MLIILPFLGEIGEGITVCDTVVAIAPSEKPKVLEFPTTSAGILGLSIEDTDELKIVVLPCNFPWGWIALEDTALGDCGRGGELLDKKPGTSPTGMSLLSYAV